MHCINIVLADKDKEFLEAVKNYVLYSQTNINIACFSESEAFEKYIKNDNTSHDLILASPEMIKDKNNKKITLWHDGKVTGNMDKYNLISKYISGEKLICELLNIYSEQNPNVIIKNNKEKDTKVCVFLSPAGGTGKTSCAYSCARISAQRGYKVLYMSFEEFQSIPLFFEYNTHSFTEALFFIKQRYKNLKIKFEGIMNCSFNNLYYFSPVESINDFNNITKEDINILINVLISQCEFDLIICDLSYNFYSWSREIILNSTNIVVVLNQNNMCLTKMNILMKEMDLIFNSKDIPKFIHVINRYVEDAVCPFNDKQNIIKIPNVNPFIISKSQFVINDEYEIAIENLLGEVMQNGTGNI